MLAAAGGTALAAAESFGRLSYAMELDPRYVAAGLERLALMGLAPRRQDVVMAEIGPNDLTAHTS